LFSALGEISPGFVNVIGIVVSTKALRQARTNGGILMLVLIVGVLIIIERLDSDFFPH